MLNLKQIWSAVCHARRTLGANQGNHSLFMTKCVPSVRVESNSSGAALTTTTACLSGQEKIQSLTGELAEAQRKAASDVAQLREESAVESSKRDREFACKAAELQEARAEVDRLRALLDQARASHKEEVERLVEE
eukprot:scaffold298163_cov31-Prasinocladus_malaysianus.AAC.1